jgi:hypothetical protein
MARVSSRERVMVLGYNGVSEGGGEGKKEDDVIIFSVIDNVVRMAGKSVGLNHLRFRSLEEF